MTDDFIDIRLRNEVLSTAKFCSVVKMGKLHTKLAVIHYKALSNSN
jgi:hypothetical protein